MIDVNFKGTVFCTKKIIKLMLKNGNGRIINFSSIASLYPLKGTVFTQQQKVPLMYLLNLWLKKLKKKILQ